MIIYSSLKVQSMGVNEPNQAEHLSVQACLIILTSLKFCSNLAHLFAEPSLDELLLNQTRVKPEQLDIFTYKIQFYTYQTKLGPFIKHKTLFKLGLTS